MSITPERIAKFFTGADNDFHEGLDAWPSIRAKDNVVEIRVTPLDEEGCEDKANAADFRAVVVEGTEPPIVFDRATFEQQVNERFDNAIRKLGSESITFMPATVAALRQQILSLDVDLADQGEAETR